MLEFTLCVRVSVSGNRELSAAVGRHFLKYFTRHQPHDYRKLAA